MQNHFITIIYHFMEGTLFVAEGLLVLGRVPIISSKCSNLNRNDLIQPSPFLKLSKTLWHQHPCSKRSRM